MRLAEGLALAHAFIVAAFLIGSTFARADADARDGAPAAMLRFICACALGFSIIGFGTFAIACAGLFTPTAAAITVVAVYAICCALAKQSPFTRAYWIARIRMVAHLFDVPHFVVYAAMLVVAMPAVNLSNAGADALAYHWAYAADWINAHGLTVDPFLREPFYAQNDLLLVALVMLFGAGALAQFPMWMMGLLTALGICAGVRFAFRESGFWQSTIGVLLALALAYSPEYLRWMDSGYLDAALGFFSLASVLALQLALRLREGVRWLATSAVIAAFLIGSKTSLLPFVAVYAAVFAVAARDLKFSRKQLFGILALLVVLASPWYARNLILAGDVIPPVLNIALHGADGLDTKFDVASVANDLHTSRDPQALLTLPVRAFMNPDTLDFREFAVNALIVFIYFPTIVLVFVAIGGRRSAGYAATLPIVILTTMIAYWFLTSTAIRYAVLFLPLLALCCGVAASMIPVSIRRAGPVFAAVFAACVVFISPTAEAHNWYHAFFVNGVENPPAYYTADRPFLEKFVDGYVEEEFTAQYLHAHKLDERLYVIGTSVPYYFRTDGIESIGDWTGPAAFFWLYHAAATGQAAQFLDGLDVDAVLIDPLKTLGGLAVPLERQLQTAGYCNVPIPQSRMRFMIKCAHRL